MDAFKFLKEFNRMCHQHKDVMCMGCPREAELTCEIIDLSPEGIKKLVRDVEQWSKEHPLSTRLQDFKKKYPNAQMCESGLPSACCMSLGYCKSCDDPENDCEACWNMPVEE